MSHPTEIDWAHIKMGDGAEPEVFAMICGIVDVTINQTANTTDRFVRDCATPGAIPMRKTKVSGMQLDISGSGLSNADTIEDMIAALGKLKNYKVELYKEGPTDSGVLLGTFGGEYRMTSSNLSAMRDSDSSAEIALASHGAWTYTPAP